jgi:hypothetical protein
MGTTHTALFHVYREHDRIVVFLIDRWGRRDVFLPGKHPVDQTWPTYPEAKPYLDPWFETHAGKPVTTRKRHPTPPGDESYPRCLAEAFSCSPYLDLWAYATARHILVSFHQTALALGHKPSREIREHLEGQGIRFRTNASGHYETALGHIQHHLGGDVADRLLLYPRQAAAFLGVTSHAVPNILHRLGIALERRSRTVVEWRSLKRVKRTSRQGFELNP